METISKCHNGGCCCHKSGHQHDDCHEGEHNELRSKLLLISATIILLGAAMAIEHLCHMAIWQLLLVYLVPYIIIGHDTLAEAWEGITSGDMFDENFLMAIATIGALAIGFLPGADTEFAEAVLVMLFFQIGELFEEYAEGKSRRSISHLMEIKPDVANVERGGNIETVSPDEVKIGETIVIRPGERVPLDGIVAEGCSALNTLALTGESLPRDVAMGDEVVSGCINQSGLIKVRTTRSFGDSTVSKIIDMVEKANDRKSKSEGFITRFSRVYTPIVVFMAIGLALLPPLVAGGAFVQTFPTWLHRALIFLVVSCPCALVISVPLTFFGGIGGASRCGILIKGSNYIDALAHTDTVVFDKTGTLTHGQFEVEAIHPDHFDERELLHMAAHVEHFTTHPIGIALRDAFPDEATDGCCVGEVEEIAGQGVRAKVDGHEVCVGNAKMMDSIGAQWHDCHHAGTIVHIAIDGTYAGHIVIGDKTKADSPEAISRLKALGVRNIVMLTGDRKEVAENVAHELGIANWHAELLPADKVEHIENIISKKEAGKALAFVGDGINDAPVLKRADIGIAMGALGSDAAIEAADVVLMDDKPSRVATAIAIARRTIGIAHQNIWFAIGVKVAILLLAAMGLGSMGMAVFADVGVMVLAVLNAMRALKSEE